jgi:hypothetical protein
VSTLPSESPSIELPIELPRAGGHSAAAHSAAIIKVKAVRKKHGRFSYEGRVKDAPHSERLHPNWVTKNFRSHKDWWEALHGELLGTWCPAPMGSASVHGVCESGIGGSALTGVSVPVVTHQGNANYCASYGPASALRHAGFAEHADHLEQQAEHVLAALTNQAAEAGEVVKKLGGFVAQRMPNYDPLTDRSPHPTILQLCASDGDNTHVVGIAGDWIFDSNRHNALPLCKESLDACCLGDASFLRSSYAIRLVPGKKLLKRKRR